MKFAVVAILLVGIGAFFLFNQENALSGFSELQLGAGPDSKIELRSIEESPNSSRDAHFAKLAYEEAGKYMKIPDKKDYTVEYSEGNVTVTFPYRYPKGREFQYPAPDYYAKITMNETTEEIVQILMGS